MKNPRFSKDAIGALRTPKKEDVVCKDCIYAAKDQSFNGETIVGATLGTCDAYRIKPPSIILKGAECPYYLSEDEE